MTHRELTQLQQRIKIGPNDSDLKFFDGEKNKIRQILKNAEKSFSIITHDLQVLVSSHSESGVNSEFSVKCNNNVREFRAPRKQLERIRDQAISEMLKKLDPSIQPDKISTIFASDDYGTLLKASNKEVSEARWADCGSDLYKSTEVASSLNDDAKNALYNSAAAGDDSDAALFLRAKVTDRAENSMQAYKIRALALHYFYAAEAIHDKHFVDHGEPKLAKELCTEYYADAGPFVEIRQLAKTIYLRIQPMTMTAGLTTRFLFDDEKAIRCKHSESDDDDCDQLVARFNDQFNAFVDAISADASRSLPSMYYGTNNVEIFVKSIREASVQRLEEGRKYLEDKKPLEFVTSLSGAFEELMTAIIDAVSAFAR